MQNRNSTLNNNKNFALLLPYKKPMTQQITKLVLKRLFPFQLNLKMLGLLFSQKNKSSGWCVLLQRRHLFDMRAEFFNNKI